MKKFILMFTLLFGLFVSAQIQSPRYSGGQDGNGYRGFTRYEVNRDGSDYIVLEDITIAETICVVGATSSETFRIKVAAPNGRVRIGRHSYITVQDFDLSNLDTQARMAAISVVRENPDGTQAWIRQPFNVFRVEGENYVQLSLSDAREFVTCPPVVEERGWYEIDGPWLLNDNYPGWAYSNSFRLSGPNRNKAYVRALRRDFTCTSGCWGYNPTGGGTDAGFDTSLNFDDVDALEDAVEDFIEGRLVVGTPVLDQYVYSDNDEFSYQVRLTTAEQGSAGHHVFVRDHRTRSSGVIIHIERGDDIIDAAVIGYRHILGLGGTFND